MPVIANATFDEAGIGLAVPGKAVGQDRHPVHLPVPFSAQQGAGPEFCGTLTHAHGTLSGLLGRPRAIEQAYGLDIQVAQLIGLQPVGQDAKQQMAGQVRGGCLPNTVCQRLRSSLTPSDGATFMNTQNSGRKNAPRERRRLRCLTW